MSGTKHNIIQDFLTIIEINTERQNILLSQLINDIRNTIRTKHETYQLLVDNPNSKFFMVDIDQIFIFQKWQRTNFISIPTNTEADIHCKFTEE